MIKITNKRNIPKDILTGIIIALVSIPISMGYSQVAGLPAIYGLYGSIFPILIFGIFSTSPQFIFGVDAAPAALAGAMIAGLGIEAGSEEAISIIPFVSALVGIWLILFAVLKAGKLVTYISVPVMGGFISGISTTIILMQIPKILGGTSGSGEAPELIMHIAETCRDSFNVKSLFFGGAALVILLLGKKICPKFPMAIVVMIGGAALGYFGVTEKFDINTLDAVEPGLPKWHIPEFKSDNLSDLLTNSFTIALVIMAETLLASKSFAKKNNYKLNENNEILVYGIGNIAACLTGCCPVNGSVSRTSMGEQYGGKSQIMSISASLTMMLVLLFATGFIGYLPVPVLTAIVISALLGTIEFDLIHRLYKHDKKELFIFLGSFAGVLIFGTIYGVIIGVILSFVSIIIRTANPKRSFLGVIPNHEGFHSLERNSCAQPLKQVIIYRFSGNLYFANIHLLTNDIESALKPDTKCVIIDSGAVCNMDITAADSIESLRKSLNSKGIHLYFASHIGAFNDRLRQLGLGGFVENGYCRMTITSVLEREGFIPPYILEEDPPEITEHIQSRLEFEWAFGKEAEAEMEKYAQKMLSQIDTDKSSEEQLSDILKIRGKWNGLSALDQEELLLHLEMHISELASKLKMSESHIIELIESRKLKIAERMKENNPEELEIIRKYNHSFEEHMKSDNPELYNAVINYRRQSIKKLINKNPEYSDIYNEFYNESEQSIYTGDEV